MRRRSGSDVLDLEAVPSDGVDPPSKFPAADHALVREHQLSIGSRDPAVRCCPAGSSRPTITITITQLKKGIKKACKTNKDGKRQRSNSPPDAHLRRSVRGLPRSQCVRALAALAASKSILGPGETSSHRFRGHLPGLPSTTPPRLVPVWKMSVLAFVSSNRPFRPLVKSPPWRLECYRVAAHAVHRHGLAPAWTLPNNGDLTRVTTSPLT